MSSTSALGKARTLNELRDTVIQLAALASTAGDFEYADGLIEAEMGFNFLPELPELQVALLWAEQDATAADQPDRALALRQVADAIGLFLEAPVEIFSLVACEDIR